MAFNPVGNDDDNDLHHSLVIREYISYVIFAICTSDLGRQRAGTKGYTIPVLNLGPVQ